MKLGCFKNGKRIQPQHKYPCYCCKFCKKHHQEQQQSDQSTDKSSKNPPAFSIFNFPPNQQLPEIPSSPFSIYNFPQKKTETSASTPYSFFHPTPRSKKQSHLSKYSFFPSEAHNPSFNLYQTPNSIPTVNIYEKWTFGIQNGADFKSICCFYKDISLF
ncbi:hypothetical protein RRG08_065941 [Elysia crispata]|uniref:Uncharacterized protein n=1 Tax=Elysia crispata TaxID=231223 RepID=A0AAE1DFJ3_9GAST|nr:hypothetical protein RRG08_065941 [Elysia crispata]